MRLPYWFQSAGTTQICITKHAAALEHPGIIDEYLQKECSMGRMLGPYSPESLPPLPELQINRFGVIPKGHNTGKWRLITDLSFPPDGSVNDGIAPELCLLTYTSVEQVAEVEAELGNGALLAKIDIESAYRLVPVHQQDPGRALEGRYLFQPDTPVRLPPRYSRQ